MISFKPLLLLFIMSIPNFLFGQNYPPIGAKWFYSEGFAFSGDIDYLTITSTKDTLIKGKKCRQLECEEVCWNPSGTQFVYYSNDSLFHYNHDLDTFQLISSFNSVKGDSWDIHVKDWDESIDTICVHVDSAGSIIINENLLKVLYISYHLRDLNTEGNVIQDYTYDSKIIERIGDIAYFFNFPIQAGLMCDMNYSQGLRCYEDSELGLFSTGIADSCTYTYNWTEIGNNNNLELEVYPNPTTDWIEVNSNMNKEITVKIFNISGQIVLNQKIFNNSRIDLTSMRPGFYLIQLTNSENITRITKLIKK